MDRTELTPQPRRLLAFIAAHMGRTGEAPTVRQMRTFMGVASLSSISRLLDDLERLGCIRRLRHRRQAIEVIDERVAYFAWNPISASLEPLAPVTATTLAAAHESADPRQDGAVLATVDAAAISGGAA